MDIQPKSPPKRTGHIHASRTDLREFLAEVQRQCEQAGEPLWFEHPEVLTARARGLNHASSRASDVRNAGYAQMLGFNAEWVRDPRNGREGKLWVQYTGLWHGRPDKCHARMKQAPAGFKYKGDPSPQIRRVRAA